MQREEAEELSAGVENEVGQTSGGKDGEAGKRTKNIHITSPELSEGLYQDLKAGQQTQPVLTTPRVFNFSFLKRARNEWGVCPGWQGSSRDGWIECLGIKRLVPLPNLTALASS